MRIDRFTQKMQEGLQAAQDLASKLGHSEVDNEHFLTALLEQNEGVARPLFDKLNVQPSGIEAKLHADLDRRAKVHGGGQLGLGRELVNVLNSAAGEMAKLKDEYLSAEH